MNPTWTILIATLGQRRERLQRLLDVLLPQVDEFVGDVRVLAFHNHGEYPLGEVRQSLVEEAPGYYVSFIDDDDLVPNYHVREVMNAVTLNVVIRDPVDYVGWQMQCYVDGVPTKPTFHSLRYRSWWEDDAGYYRDVSHLNPVQRDLALRADFRRGDPPEDVAWTAQMRPHVKTESYIGKIMYHYYSSPSDSTWGGVVVDRHYDRLPVSHPYFSYHPSSS